MNIFKRIFLKIKQLFSKKSKLKENSIGSLNNLNNDFNNDQIYQGNDIENQIPQYDSCIPHQNSSNNLEDSSSPISSSVTSIVSTPRCFSESHQTLISEKAILLNEINTLKFELSETNSTFEKLKKLYHEKLMEIVAIQKEYNELKIKCESIEQENDYLKSIKKVHLNQKNYPTKMNNKFNR